MAYNNNPKFQLLGLVCLLSLVYKSDATDYKVGGSKGWCVPSDPNAAEHNQWAERKRFQIGDSLGKFTCFFFSLSTLFLKFIFRKIYIKYFIFGTNYETLISFTDNLHFLFLTYKS